MSKGKRLRQQRQAAPPKVGKKQPPDRRLWIGAGALAALIAVGVGVALASSGGSGGAKPVGVNFAALSGLQTGAPPWNNDSGALSNDLAALHLDALGQEGSVEHIHMHLDAYVNGKHVALPAGVGIDDNSFLTELHTHDNSGVIHLESPNTHPYTLGQFFGEWGVRLTANCLGRYCGDLHWWVDGKPQSGNPANLVLKAHQELAIAAGKQPAHVPASYAFSAGE